MCYSNSLTSKNVDLKKKYKKEVPAEIAEEPLFHAIGFTHPSWRVITQSNEIQVMQWGLIPSWFKQGNPVEIANKTLNARSETIHEKPSFRGAFQRQHCIVPSTGFFEYQTNGKEKKPFFVFPKSDDLFHMAGIYDVYTDPATGSQSYGFSIVTCAANQLMSEIHNTKQRMPVVLPYEQVDQWLAGGSNSGKLLVPADESLLDAHSVNPKILKGPNHNSPAAHEPFDAPNFTQGSLF